MIVKKAIIGGERRVPGRGEGRESGWLGLLLPQLLQLRHAHTSPRLFVLLRVAAAALGLSSTGTTSYWVVVVILLWQALVVAHSGSSHCFCSGEINATVAV